MIDFSKATDEELWTILSDDWDIQEHLSNLVNEALSRQLFNPIIGHLTKKLFSVSSNEYKYNIQDLFSIAYIGIAKALNNYRNGKSAFSTFVYTAIESELIKHRTKINALKREHYKKMLSINDETIEPLLDKLIDYHQNPERAAIKRIFWEDLFSKLSADEKKIMFYFGAGYNFREIGALFGHKTGSGIMKRFPKAVKKMNPKAERVDLRFTGLTVKKRKGITG